MIKTCPCRMREDLVDLSMVGYTLCHKAMSLGDGVDW